MEEPKIVVQVDMFEFERTMDRCMDRLRELNDTMNDAVKKSGMTVPLPTCEIALMGGAVTLARTAAGQPISRRGFLGCNWRRRS
jgi:hypothetical protein